MKKNKQFIFGDIHGCLKTFEALLDKCSPAIEDEIYLLGDYIDRGPDSRGVIDKILALQNSSYNVKPIIGNHEYMLLDSLSSMEGMMNWAMNGANSTLDSFAVSNAHEIDEKYLNFSKA